MASPKLILVPLLALLGSFADAAGKGKKGKRTMTTKRDKRAMKGKKTTKKSFREHRAPSRPLNIILTNDDGFETELIQSLFHALSEDHNVIMSAPYSGQSGTSGLIEFLVPLISTMEDSPGGTITAGSPAIGPTGLGDQQFYVAGAVTSAVLYGVDVLAHRHFGGPPDLVISGPNEGNNVGLLTPHSGTVGAAVTAINKGIPSIAVSADSDEERPDLIADLIVELIDRMGASLQGGLNVNIPNTAGYEYDDFEFVPTQIGLAASIALQFVENLQTDCPFAALFGVDFPHPGMCVVAPYTDVVDEDPDPASEFNAISSGPVVAISPMQSTYQGDERILKQIGHVFY